MTNPSILFDCPKTAAVLLEIRKRNKIALFAYAAQTLAMVAYILLAPNRLTPWMDIFLFCALGLKAWYHFFRLSELSSASRAYLDEKTWPIMDHLVLLNEGVVTLHRLSDSAIRYFFVACASLYGAVATLSITSTNPMFWLAFSFALWTCTFFMFMRAKAILSDLAILQRLISASAAGAGT